MIALYGHNGSNNHGCEAIVRTTTNLLNEKCVLFSGDLEKDLQYGIDQICEVRKQGKEIRHGSVRHIAYKAVSIASGSVNHYAKRSFQNLLNSRGFEYYVSIGGDNYCYNNMPQMLGYVNKQLKKKGKTILWGCSIEEDILKDHTVIEDLKQYDLITVRESYTYTLLKKAGVSENICRVSDPAFTLKPEAWELSGRIKDSRIIGINVSPLIYKYGDKELIEKNILNLINSILTNTSYTIALIPHVVCRGNNDIETLDSFYQKVANKERILTINDMNCRMLKYLISKCEFFIGARTHATIAAYSTNVPTLVLGYSIKSIGIAHDIFEDRFDQRNFVLSVQELKDKNSLEKMFSDAWDKKTNIRKYLTNIMPTYIEKAYEGRKAIDRI